MNQNNWSKIYKIVENQVIICVLHKSIPVFSISFDWKRILIVLTERYFSSPNRIKTYLRKTVSEMICCIFK